MGIDIDREDNISGKLYEKEVVCPVCDSKFSVKAVKSRHVRIESRDSDFMIRYKDPNPLFYDIWLCIRCGYAAQSSRFGEISGTERENILKNITKKWNRSREIPYTYTVDTAIELYQLALLTSMVKEDKDSDMAHLCLKLAWLFRIKGDTENESRYITHALNQFLKAYENEKLPVAGLDEPSLMYLIGELYRRTGDNSNALKWFSRVLVNKGASPKIKDMAREQKDLMRS